MAALSLSKGVPSFVGLIACVRYCEFRIKDPIETLKLSPISVLHNLFHWMLHIRIDTLRTANTLQTYWNTFYVAKDRRIATSLGL